MVLRGGLRGRVGRRRTCLKRVVPTAVVERPSSLVWVLWKAGGWLEWRTDPERRRVGRQVAAARVAGSRARRHQALAGPAERAGRLATRGASRLPAVRTHRPVGAVPPDPHQAKGRSALPAHLPPMAARVVRVAHLRTDAARAPAAAAGRVAHPRAARCAAIPARGPAKARVEPRGRQALAPHGKAHLEGRAPAAPAIPRGLPPKMSSGAAGPTRPAGPGRSRQMGSPALRRGPPPRASSVAARGRRRVTGPGSLTGVVAVRAERPGRAAPTATVRRRRTSPGQLAVPLRAALVGAPRRTANVTGHPSATSGARAELPRQATVPAGQRDKAAQRPPERTEPRAAGTGPRAAGTVEILTPRARGPGPASQVPAGLTQAGRALAGPAQAGPVLAGPARAGRALAGPVQIGPVQVGPAQAGPARAGLALAIAARLVAAVRDRVPPRAGTPVDLARTERRRGRLAAGKARPRVMPAVTAAPGRDAQAAGRRTAAGRGREAVPGAPLWPFSPGRPVRRCQIRSAPISSIPKHVPS